MFVIGGTWALAVAVRKYVYRNAPLVIALTPRELIIENGPWLRTTRRIPRGEIQSIQTAPSGAHRTMVLLIKARREVELMADRETDEIERVAAALSTELAAKHSFSEQVSC
jgi:hypothetical protein